VDRAAGGWCTPLRRRHPWWKTTTVPTQAKRSHARAFEANRFRLMDPGSEESQGDR
jgi:hypothetical protein